MASTGHVTCASLQPGGIEQWSQQTTFVFRMSFPGVVKLSPTRPEGVDLIKYSGERWPSMYKEQKASGLSIQEHAYRLERRGKVGVRA